MLPLEQKNMYSDPYQGSYHLRCLTEAEILSSSHYHRMTSAQRHGSNYIIQAHNTLAARQHQSSSTFSLLPLFSPLVCCLSSLSPSTLFFIFYPFISSLSFHPPHSSVQCTSASTDEHRLQFIQPLVLKVEGFEIDYNHLNCFTG